jgi:hypothetical protein
MRLNAFLFFIFVFAWWTVGVSVTLPEFNGSSHAFSKKEDGSSVECRVFEIEGHLMNRTVHQFSAELF